MEIFLFSAVFVLVSLVLLVVSLVSPPSANWRRKAGFLSMPDLPEGEIHLVELVVLAALLGLFASLVATALSA